MYLHVCSLVCIVHVVTISLEKGEGDDIQRYWSGGRMFTLLRENIACTNQKYQNCPELKLNTAV